MWIARDCDASVRHIVGDCFRGEDLGNGVLEVVEEVERFPFPIWVYVLLESAEG